MCTLRVNTISQNVYLGIIYHLPKTPFQSMVIQLRFQTGLQNWSKRVVFQKNWSKEFCLYLVVPEIVIIIIH